MKRYDAELVGRATRILREKNEKGKLIKGNETKRKEKEILDAYKKHKQIEKDTGPKPLTPIQEKFVDIYCSRYGEWSARRCAIAAGYGKGGAHTRANELLDPQKNPHIVLEINQRLAATREEWEVNRDKHLAMLVKIRDASMEKGMYGVANKAEELRGKVAGLYVERNLTLTKELSNEDLHDKMKEIFPTKEAFLAGQRDIMKDLFPDDDEE